MTSKDEKIIRNKVGLLKLAEELGNVSRACKVMGYSRDTFYRWELTEAFLAGRKVTVCRTLAEPQRAPWVEHEGVAYRLQPIDPVANGKTKRKRPSPGVDAVDFDPSTVLLNRAVRRPRGGA